METLPGLSSWNFCTAKRVLDIIFSVLLLLATFPLWLLAAAAIKLTSAGPVFFRQVRSGQNGKEFRLLKFRSMVWNGAASGPGLTQAGDRRVTWVGRRLRQWKMDELPQLVNVLRGEMSLVGPRPDLVEYMRELSQEQQAILQLRPGITGVSSLKFVNEEKIFSTVPPEELISLYIRELLPRKIQLDLAYAQRASFRSDLKVLMRTLMTIFYRNTPDAER